MGLIEIRASHSQPHSLVDTIELVGCATLTPMMMMMMMIMMMIMMMMIMHTCNMILYSLFASTTKEEAPISSETLTAQLHEETLQSFEKFSNILRQNLKPITTVM